MLTSLVQKMSTVLPFEDGVSIIEITNGIGEDYSIAQILPNTLGIVENYKAVFLFYGLVIGNTYVLRPKIKDPARNEIQMSGSEVTFTATSNQAQVSLDFSLMKFDATYMCFIMESDQAQSAEVGAICLTFGIFRDSVDVSTHNGAELLNEDTIAGAILDDPTNKIKTNSNGAVRLSGRKW